MPTITAAEINYLAFNIASTDYHIELYGNLQHKLGDANVIDTDTYIKSHNLYNAYIYRRLSSFTNRNGHVTNYETLSTYIRNSIDHPDPIKRPYTSSSCRVQLIYLLKFAILFHKSYHSVITTGCQDTLPATVFLYCSLFFSAFLYISKQQKNPRNLTVSGASYI